MMFNDIIKRQSQGLARIAVLSVAVVFLLSGCSDGPTYTPPEPQPPKPPLPPVEIPDGYVWTELPALPDEDDPALVENGGHLEVITHRATFHSGSVSFESRNYSMLYDREQKVSHWVAYPMHRVFINGGGSREDVYMYDPYVPKEWQSSATTDDGHGYGGGWQRGHQIAAADRNSSQAANDQTFYMTNMTPQNGNLNGGEWAGLETWVRDRAKESGRQDTLYVVSGCWLGGNPDHIANRNEVAIPEAYYKVLLRTASGKRAFPSDDDCELVGFWVENRAPGTGYEEWTMGVAEIERRTGFDFFPSISNEAQNSADDPSQWNGL